LAVKEECRDGKEKHIKNVCICDQSMPDVFRERSMSLDSIDCESGSEF